MNSLRLIAPAAHLLAEAPDVGARPDVRAAELAVEHRAAGDDQRRQVAARRAHDERRRGLVAAAEQDDAVDRVGADRLLDVHADARLRKSIAVGRMLVSPSDITGNSNGTPPASHTPRFTCSASSRKCPLHGVSSDQVLQMPMIGPAVENPFGQSAADPAAMNESVFVWLGEPGG